MIAIIAVDTQYIYRNIHIKIICTYYLKTFLQHFKMKTYGVDIDLV